jgi:hypothetical protein
MNRRADVSLTFALCASLALHGLLSLALAEAFVREVGARIWLPPPAPRALHPAEADAPLPRFDLEEDPRRRLGDAGGTGYAIDESPGDKQLLARHGALDQPMLSRDPIGPGRVGDDPSEWTAAPGEGGAAEPLRLPAPVFASTPEAHVLGIAPPVAVEVARREPVTVAPPEPVTVAPAHAEDAPDSTDASGETAPAQPAREGAATPIASPAPAAPGGDPGSAGARPGPRVAADPAPRGESEIDPVAVVGTMDFRSGSTTVRAGRKHRIIRPRLTLDAKLDLATMGSTYVILLMRLDERGNVTSSEIARSSGSDSVDQVFKVTSYEWWFEPARDSSANRPVPDQFQFVIRIN